VGMQGAGEAGCALNSAWFVGVRVGTIIPIRVCPVTLWSHPIFKCNHPAPSDDKLSPRTLGLTRKSASEGELALRCHICVLFRCHGQRKP
jgi:hypothetical protein